MSRLTVGRQVERRACEYEGRENHQQARAQCGRTDADSPVGIDRRLASVQPGGQQDGGEGQEVVAGDRPARN